MTEQSIQIGDRVGWEETYRTGSGVISTRVEWGRVLEVFEHRGDDGYPIAGLYALVDQENSGRGLGAVLVSSLISTNKV